MTTILKAAQLEAGELNPKQIRPTDRAQHSRWPWVAGPLLVLVGCAVFYIDRASNVERPAAVLDSPAATRQTAPTPLTRSTESELPWGRVEERKYAPHGARKTIAQPASKAPTPAAVTAVHAAEHGGARVQLKSINYSQDTARRSVTLMIEGGSSITLHEGESARDIEVQLILPRMVYLREGATVFAVRRTF